MSYTPPAKLTAGTKAKSSYINALIDTIVDGFADTQTGYTYVPDQVDFSGSIFLGDGGLSLQHIAGATGQQNSGFGFDSLSDNTTGYSNTGGGYKSLEYTTTGYQNTAFGASSLTLATTSYCNTATGYHSMYNAFGNENVACGVSTLALNASSQGNTAIGYMAMYNSSPT